ncbi:histidine phosphatase family protein [Nocardia abscessus]|uniref:histidine phosphatase family protein n=1 Tax=Nocardia abscessus TaxID=120957 RepID=UPI0024587EB6|nr:histidine phosphatase family protein [Nocardia abscessus]
MISSAPAAGTRMLLICPGHSLADARNEFMGPRRCRGLDRTGHDQVQLLGRALAALPLQVAGIYYTDVARAEDTANLLAIAFGGPAVEAALECRAYGAADGKLIDEVLATFDPPLELSPDTPLADGAESWTEVADRTRRELEHLTDRHPGQTLLIVCDQDTIAASFQLYLDVPPTRSQSIHTDNTAITEWISAPARDSEDGAQQHRWILIRHNDRAHLANPPTPASGVRSGSSFSAVPHGLGAASIPALADVSDSSLNTP